MHIQITGKHLDTGASLREHVEEHIHRITQKFFDKSSDTHVTFSKQGAFIQCDIGMHLDMGIHLQSHDSDTDIYVSFDGALQKIEKQLRRHKRRIRDH